MTGQERRRRAKEGKARREARMGERGQMRLGQSDCLKEIRDRQERSDLNCRAS